MLRDMHLLKDVNKSGKEMIQFADGDRPEYALEDDFMVVLEQRDILKQYIKQFNQIKKKEHRAYWETIKRVHAKRDLKEMQEREQRQLIKEIEQ